ncbi:MAG: hypothetical protein AAF629_06090 [Chloroflexota bacterium]
MKRENVWSWRWGRIIILLGLLLFLVNAGGSLRRLRRDDLPPHSFTTPLQIVHLPEQYARRSSDFTANVIGSSALFVKDVRYQLNGSAWQPVGRGGRRAPAPLFVLELMPDTLLPGANQVAFEATTYFGYRHVITETFTYDPAPSSLPLTIDWANQELDVGDGVWEHFEFDGEWRVRTKPGYEGYDRLLVVAGAFSGGRRIETDLIFRGTVNERDYGFGLLPMWAGRPDERSFSPKRGWNFSLVWYWSRYKGVGNEFSYRFADDDPVWVNGYRDLDLQPNQRYQLIIEAWPVTDTQGEHSHYHQRMKWWPADQPEPEQWLTLNDTEGAPLPEGEYGVAFLAYYSQVDYGPVTITRIKD